MEATNSFHDLRPQYRDCDYIIFIASSIPPQPLYEYSVISAYFTGNFGPAGNSRVLADSARENKTVKY